jgi:hypothetical protein
MPHLPPAHHETSKCDSPNETKIKVKLPKCLIFKFKHHQVNDASQSNQELATWFLKDNVGAPRFNGSKTVPIKHNGNMCERI